MTKTLEELAIGLENGSITSLELTEKCLVAAKEGEGPRAFISLNADSARQAAYAFDKLRKSGAHPSRYAGIPISLKDLFDVRGQVTRAGSVALEGSQTAEIDAPAIANLRQAGFVFIGRTNMTEFAYSGLGLNPHYGTPANPWDRKTGRIPGGSSSGAAISITDNMAYAGVGTDTGGSCRIPAALCGIVGYKPTQSLVSLHGVSPLSASLDSVGSLGSSSRCVQVLNAIMAGQTIPEMRTAEIAGLRLLAPTNLVRDGIDKKVAADFDALCERLRNLGAIVTNRTLEPLDRLQGINAGGGFAASEAFHWHAPLIQDSAAKYDPRVLVRIRKGESQSAADYLTLLAQRNRFIQDMALQLADHDALIMPTVPTIAPAMSDLEDDDVYGKINLLMLRNSSIINFLDGCAISLPMHQSGTAPTGLMVAGLKGQDARIFELAHGLTC